MKLTPGSLVHAPAHLVDVLPTLAEVAGAKVPDSYPGRQPAPLAGVSLAPILAGKPATTRPPIHLLYGSNRGLRDGDWKLVSFQSQPWELYNLAMDRTESHNVAGRHPEITGRMVRQWHDMTAKVLMAPEKERLPVAATATAKQHPEWSTYTDAAPPRSPKSGKNK